MPDPDELPEPASLAVRLSVAALLAAIAGAVILGIVT